MKNDGAKFCSSGALLCQIEQQVWKIIFGTVATSNLLAVSSILGTPHRPFQRSGLRVLLVNRTRTTGSRSLSCGKPTIVKHGIEFQCYNRV